MWSTVSWACLISSGFSGGTVISEMDTVIAALVENLYPVALISSSTSAVLVAPCVLITFSRICFSCFFPTWKSTSRSSSFPSTSRSTNPRSCGIISLNNILPSVPSIVPVFTVPSGISLETRTLILECSVTYPFSYARSASFKFLKNIPSPVAPGLSCVR